MTTAYEGELVGQARILQELLVIQLVQCWLT